MSFACSAKDRIAGGGRWLAGLGRRRAAIRYPLPIFLLAIVTALSASAASLTASLDRDTITLGESATLSLAFEGGSPRNAPAPQVAGLQIVYSGSAQNLSIINGQVTSTVTLTYSVTPRQVGEFTIPAVTADVGGQRISAQPLTLKVLKPGAPPPEAIQSGTQPAFAKLVLPKKEIYLGEVITAELQIYYRQGLQPAGQPQLTGFPADGLTVGRFVGGQTRQVQIGNAVYGVMTFTASVTAIKTGALTLGPVTLSTVVLLPSSGNRRGSLFDDMPDPFGMFDRREQRQLNLATDPVAVQSLPLPTDHVPPNFNGAVGNYTLTVNAGPTNVATGDPITVRVRIAGRGALDALALPEQPAWHDFKTYAPTARVETSDQLGIQGAKTFEQIVSPQNTDVRELPVFSFSYFDPDQKAYRTLTQPPIGLVVRSGGATAVPILASKNSTPETPPPTQDIVPIKQRLGAAAQIAPPLVQQPWFLALQSAPVLAWFAALAWRKRTDWLTNNPRVRRQRQVAHLIRTGLDDLRRLARENNPDEFFATLFRLLQEQLGERLDCPASAITEAVIEERLRPRGVTDEVLAPLHDLFQACNLARYAPVRTTQELEAAIPKLEVMLRELQKLT